MTWKFPLASSPPTWPVRWPWLYCSEVDPATIAARLHDLPPVEHRLSAVPSSTGCDHPGRHLQLQPGRRALGTPGAGDRRGWRTRPTRPAGADWRWSRPGWSSSGSGQFAENREFGAAAAAVATDLVIVGRTNRRALEAGSRLGAGSATRVIRVTPSRPGR